MTVGLSKNPAMTVQEKRLHIAWFKTYFEDKLHHFHDVYEDDVNEDEEADVTEENVKSDINATQ